VKVRKPATDSVLFATKAATNVTSQVADIYQFPPEKAVAVILLAISETIEVRPVSPARQFHSEVESIVQHKAEPSLRCYQMMDVLCACTNWRTKREGIIRHSIRVPRCLEFISDPRSSTQTISCGRLHSGLLPADDSSPTLVPVVEDPPPDDTYDRSRPNLPLANIRMMVTVLSGGAAGSVEAHSWYERVGVPAHKFAVGDLGYVEPGQKMGYDFGTYKI
jgi:hypothetical protein